MTIVEFLRQRLDEDEAAAREADDGRHWSAEDEHLEPWPELPNDESLTFPRKAHARHAARHDPIRVRREIEAKRRIVDRAEFVADHGPAKDDVRALDMSTGASAALDDVLRHLALPYWDHPDYDPAWG